MQQGRNQSDEAEETACILCGVPEEVIGHEGKREFHAGKEEDEGEVGGVEESVGVCALFGMRGLGGGIVGAGNAVAIGEFLVGRGGRSGARECLREAEVEVCGFGDDEEEGESGGRGEGVLLDGLDGAEPGTERGPKGKGYGEAGANQGHGCPALILVADVRRDSHGELDIALAQTTDYSAREERSEVGCSDPERNAENIARHRPKQRGSASVAVRERANYGGCDGLEEREKRAEGPAEEYDVIAVVDGLRERVLVGIEAGEDAREDGRRCVVLRGFVVAVELEELGEKGENEGEGYL